MSLSGTLREISNKSDWEELCKCLGAKFPGQKQVVLGEDLASVKDQMKEH